MEKKKYHTKWKHENLPYNWVHNPEEDVEWQEIPESEFTHYMHFNKGSAAKYDKICHAIVDYFWDSISEEEKEKTLRTLYFNEFRDKSPKRVLELLDTKGILELILDQEDVEIDDFLEPLKGGPRPTRG